MSSKYLDFDLKIDVGTYPTYRVRATCSSISGEQAGMMQFPWNPQELENHLLKVQNALLSGGNQRRKQLAPEEKTVRDFGQTLFDILFTENIRTLYRESQRMAADQGKSLRIRLAIQAAELVPLPWEFLYDHDKRRAEYLCLDTAFVRYVELDRPMPSHEISSPLRILGMAASPKGISPIDIQEEKARLAQAIEPLQQKRLVELVWVEGQTWRDLQQTLRDGPWHLFHFVGHGDFDPVRKEGRIILADEQGNPTPFYATDLGRILDTRTLRLVLLNACESGQSEEQDIFSSIAGTLVQKGVPAVLSMQYAITDQAAIEFSRSFYEALVYFPIDAAVVEARKSMTFSHRGSLEWGIPVLYMGASDGVLFEGKVEAKAQRRGGIRWISGVMALLMVVLLVVVGFSSGYVQSSLNGLFSLLTPTPTVVVDRLSGGDEVLPETTVRSETETPTPLPTDTLVPPTGTAVPPTAIPKPTDTPVVPTATLTPMPPTKTATPEPTDTPIPPTATHTKTPPPTLTPTATKPRIGDTWVNPKDGATYVYVPAGEFLMGSSDEQIDFFIQEICSFCNRDRFQNQQPVHTVYLDAFWIMQTEVTNAQYARCVEAGVCEKPDNTIWDDVNMQEHPVVNITWSQAKAYAEWSGGRLPTEAEWEKAALGANGYLYPWGNDAPNADLLNDALVTDSTTSVGSYPKGASPYGALDMAGNVWEWTADWYDSDYYESAPRRNPKGPSDGTRRVMRGGAFYVNANYLRPADRIGNDPSYQDRFVGVRVVRHETAREN